MEARFNAFGLAYHQTRGNMQCTADVALAKRQSPGLSVSNGITAVKIAQKDITGAKNVLQGSRRLFNVYHRGDYNY